MTAFLRRGKAELTTPCRKVSVAACGRRPYRQDNDTPALNALTALRGAPTSMGRGETKLRELMDSGELEYIQNGNRRLIADAAIWDWYHRAKRSAKPPTTQGGLYHQDKYRISAIATAF